MIHSGLPRITVVTPSFNQARYLERTICSVLNQGYPNLEYIIVDGGSKDGSVDIIKKYAAHLAWWVSEPDAGQVYAINKGFRRATGDWVAWQNSDDVYREGAFHGMAAAAARHPRAGLIVGDMLLIDAQDRPLRDIRYVRPTYKALLAEGMVLTNQSAFWRRSLHDEIGLLNDSYQCSFDYEWFLRLTQHAKAAHVPHLWGALRLHEETKTSLLKARFEEEQKRILAGRAMPAWQKNLYRIRRAALMAARGQGGYVLRGLWRRLQRREGEFD